MTCAICKKPFTCGCQKTTVDNQIVHKTCVKPKTESK